MAKLSQSDLEALPENLLREAIEALKYGLKFNYDYCNDGETGLLKQSILNFHRFVELTLKYFIANINSLLVFEKPFDEKIDFQNPKTISFNQALNFYCHNAEMGLLTTHSNFDKASFKTTLHSLRDLRNDVTHLFLTENDEQKLQSIFSENVRLIFLVFVEQDIYQHIEKNLTDDENEMLNELIDIEKEKVARKLAIAIEKVDEYASSRSSPDPKDQNPLEAPVFDCPNCGNHTFILTPDDKYFYCTYCDEKEVANTCSGPFGCANGLIPDSHLSMWNEEHGDKICEECLDEYNYRIRRE